MQRELLSLLALSRHRKYFLISTRFLERPERIQRSLQPPFCYVVNNLSLLRCESIDSKGSREVMRVVEIETQDQQRRYVVIDDVGMLVEPIVRYLKYLDRIGAARNTLQSR